MSNYFENLRREKEIIKLREESKSDWRKELDNEHPYVDVMPDCDQKEEDAKKKVKKKKEEKDSEEEVVKEQVLDERNFGSGYADQERAAAERASRSRSRNSRPDNIFTRAQDNMDADNTRVTNQARSALGQSPVRSSRTMEPVKPVKTRTIRQSRDYEAEKNARNASPRPSSSGGNRPGQTPHSSQETAPSRPSRPAPSSSRPAPSSSRPAPSSSTPKPSTTNKDPMAAWAKANPKLAAAKAERDRTRGTSSSTNPLMKDMKSSAPAAKPVSTPKPSTPKPSTPKPSTPSPSIPKPSTPKPSTPKVSGIKSPGLASALSDTASMKFKSEEVVHESIKDDPEHQENFKKAADNVAKGMKKLNLSKYKKSKK